MIVQRENDNQMVLLPVTHLINSSVTRIKLNNTTTFKSDLNNRKQERGRIIQLGNEEECMEQLQILEMVAEIDEQNSSSDDNDELNESEKQTNNKQDKNKTNSKKQVKEPSRVHEHLNSKSNSDITVISKKQTKSILKPKENMTSKYSQIEKEVDQLNNSKNHSLSTTSNSSLCHNKSLKKPVNTSTTTVSKKQATNSFTKQLHNKDKCEHQVSSNSQRINDSQSRNIKKNLVPDTEMLENSNYEKEMQPEGEEVQQEEEDEVQEEEGVQEEEEDEVQEEEEGIQEEEVQQEVLQQKHMDDNDLLYRYEMLSKKCNNLIKENGKLQSERDHLVQENEKFKKTTMPIPDAAGQQWFIMMGHFFEKRGANVNIGAHAIALNVNAQALVECIKPTTSNTARQVVRLLYSPSKLLSKTGRQIPDSQRLAIRAFAESIKGPIDDRDFNEAVNGVFRSAKENLKEKTKSKTSSKSTSNESLKQSNTSINNGQKTLKEIITKKKAVYSNHAVVDKENNNVEEHQDKE